MKYIFHPEALEEYQSAISYYFEINPQLAESFIKAIETGIENIIMFPEAWSIVEEDVRRHLISRFPFGIYYCVENNCISIYAVMHMSRHPEYWKKRRNLLRNVDEITSTPFIPVSSEGEDQVQNKVTIQN